MNDEELVMDVVGVSLPEEELGLRCLRIQVRVKGIIEALVTGTDGTQTPLTLFQFLHRLMREGKFLPGEYFNPAERKRIVLDANGRTTY